MTEAKKKKNPETSELIVNTPAAKAKLAEKCGDFTKITKRDICSLLLACFGGHVRERASKLAMVQILYAEIQDRPEAMQVSADPTTAVDVPVTGYTFM